jgi:periplasmic protein TonB
MFEHYLRYQAPDTRRRWRVALAINVAGFATTGLVGFMWLMDKLMIAQVAPPTASFVMVQMAMETFPPPPAPPAAPSVRAPEEDRPEPEEDELTPPETFAEELPTPKARPSKVIGNGPPTSTGTSPFGSPPGIPGIPGGGIPGLPPGTGIATRSPPKPESRAPVPINTVRAQAIYAPHPDQGRLGATRAATFDRRPGENETAFCVDEVGRTVDVRTVKKFPGDPKVDEICRDTIKTWRFKPFKVDGKPTRTCSVQVFNITFK